MREERKATVAVVLPCHNEAGAIGEVVRAFRKVLPDAEILVVDNCSTDLTASEARDAGARVIAEERRGKGNAFARRAFSYCLSDVCGLADGDGTYDAAAAPAMIKRLIDDDLDMVIGARSITAGEFNYRPGHRFGNWVLTSFVARVFGHGFSDMLSGYRVFTRQFVKSFPALSTGFEIETELNVHALSLKLAAVEINTGYTNRLGGTSSKLKTVRDGVQILMAILTLIRDYQPLRFFTIVAAVFAVTSVVLAVPIITEYEDTGLVPRFPTAVLCTGLMVCAALSQVAGVILDSLARHRLEVKRLAYLAAGSRK